LIPKINLLPRAAKRRFAFGKRIFQVFLPLGVLAGLVLYYLALQGTIFAIRTQIAKTDQEIARLQPEVTRVQELRRQIDASKRREVLLAQLLASQLPASAILGSVRTLIPKEAWITLVNVPDTSSFNIEGYAMSYVVVARLMDNLESSQMFSDIDLSVVERDKIDKFEVIKYKVVGTLVRPTGTPESGR
jgi:Tfp pilus assembly protein PilN